MRLQQILSLRALGLPLDEIRAVLARRAPPLEVLERHLARVRAEMRDRERLFATLESLVARLRDGGTPTAELLLRSIEETNMLDKYFTKEQLERLHARRQEISEERVRQVAGEWQAVIAEARAAMERGVDPTDASLARLAEKWVALIREFSGGDRDIETATAKMYRAEPELGAKHGMDRALDVFVGAMLRANGQRVGAMA